MRISDNLVVQLLTSTGSVTDDQLQMLADQEVADKKPLQDVAIRNGLISESDLTQLYAAHIDVPYVELDPHAIPAEVLKQIPERIARQYKAVLYGQDKAGSKLLAMSDPDDVQAVNFLRKQLGSNIVVHIATASAVSAALEQYRRGMANELPKIITVEDHNEADQINEEDLAEDSPIARTVNMLIEYAITNRASDIHIEPRETFVLVRYRVDGILREANKLPRNVLGALISRIKILSNLKIDERRVPQDGRFKIEVGGQVYALRVSTLPVVNGEKVAMRILNESAKAATLLELGFWGAALETIQHAIIQPHGMVLVTGPTGSGKSTTLFSILSSLNKPGVTISTIEDPVEYRIQGTNQTQVNTAAGMTFSSGLRALLRQDPNIIMVGEIHDNETANLAVQTAHAGHLVFSTLPTTNAATGLSRLLRMNIEPYLVASTVRVVIGQRLVRKLCTKCREAVTPNAATRQTLHKTFHTNDATVMQRLNALELEAMRTNLGGEFAVQENGSSQTAVVKLYQAREGGCVECHHTGYKGRLGLYEALSNSTAVQSLIAQNSPSEEIQNQSIADGMVTIQTDGLVKALRGLTSIAEVLRVTAEG